jgi:hypothetical protein
MTTSLVLVLVLLACTACVGIPRSGAVQAGRSVATDEDIDITFIPSGPQPGSTPEQVLRGFIAAATGPQNDYAVAREYLAPDLAESWQPDASVLVDTSADRRFETRVDETARLSVFPAAQVDGDGLYQPNPSDNPVDLDYAFEEIDGQWRISSAPDGIVLDSSTFATVFSAHSLMFFDPTWTYLVPDVRWFATRPSTATEVVQELLDGPSAWLSPGVRTAFPDGTSLASETVTVDGDAVRMNFSGGFVGENAIAQSRMKAQLSASLTGIGTVSQDSIAVEGAIVSIDTLSVPVPRVDARALVLSQEGFGYLSGGGVERIAGVSDGIESLSPSAVSMGVGSAFAAALASGGVYVVPADGSAPVNVDARAGLIAPSVDPFGYTWSVPRDDPSALVAFDRDGGSTPVTTSWPEASSIAAFQVSRDGTRVAALVSSGGVTRVVVAAVTRSEPGGAPTGIGDLFEVGETVDTPVALTWVDDGSFATLVHGDGGDGRIEIHTIGSRSEVAPALSDATTIVGVNTPQQVRALVGSGEIRVRSGSGWQTRATGVQVLATQLATLG